MSRSTGVRSAASCAMLTLGLWTTPAHADPIYQTQSRIVQGLGSDHSETFSATDFGPFSMTANGSGFYGGGRGVQNSVLGATTITAHGTADGYPGNQQQGGSGSSSFSVQFLLSSPALYRMSGSWSFYLGGAASVDIDLAGPGGDVLHATGALPGPFSGSFDQSGILAPGVYHLTASATGHGGFGSSAGSAFDFTLAVPAPGAGLGLLLSIACLGGRARRRT
jgi:hypothetical protein